MLLKNYYGTSNGGGTLPALFYQMSPAGLTTVSANTLAAQSLSAYPSALAAVAGSGSALDPVSGASILTAHPLSGGHPISQTSLAASTQLTSHLTDSAACQQISNQLVACHQHNLKHQQALNQQTSNTGGLMLNSSLSPTRTLSPLSSTSQTKKFRPPYTRPSNRSSRYIPKPMPQELGHLKTYSSPDILICGNCREMFSDLVDLLDHKKEYCKLRFTCKCDYLNLEREANDSNTEGSRIKNESGNAVCRSRKWLHCVSCKLPFSTAWDLMVHVQTAHMINIYQLADSTEVPTSSQPTPPFTSAANTSTCGD